MRKYTLRELKNLVRCGMAHDLTNATAAEVMEQWRHGEKVGYSLSVYGINGGLIRNTETGEYYAITAHNSNLFRIFRDLEGGVNMKYFWIAAVVREGNRHYAFAFRVSENDNLKCRLEGVQNLSSANIMPSKKAACELVNHWNACFKANGTYMFDGPGF